MSSRRMDWEQARSVFEERSAILEFDTGMPRAEAEAQAVAELYDALQARPRQKPGDKVKASGPPTLADLGGAP
jgi:hypothetical protein